VCACACACACVCVCFRVCVGECVCVEVCVCGVCGVCVCACVYGMCATYRRRGCNDVRRRTQVPRTEDVRISGGSGSGGSGGSGEGAPPHEWSPVPVLAVVHGWLRSAALGPAKSLLIDCLVERGELVLPQSLAGSFKLSGLFPANRCLGGFICLGPDLTLPSSPHVTAPPVWLRCKRRSRTCSTPTCLSAAPPCPKMCAFSPATGAQSSLGLTSPGFQTKRPPHHPIPRPLCNFYGWVVP
jgi:hypothetical protein